MKRPAYLRLGVDVGGTNTDCALVDPKSTDPVVSSFKHATTPDITSGIQGAIEGALKSAENVAMTDVEALSIGTTHFVNALIEKDTSRLDKVAVIRLCGPFSRGCPPFAGFPKDLKSILQGPTFMVEGGLQIDGSIITPVDPEEIVKVCKVIKEQNIKVVAIVSVFAPIDFDYKQEEQVAAILAEHLPKVHTVCSKYVANIGILERENASILNAALLRYARKTVRHFQSAAADLKLTCPVFITGNDGTLLTCEQAAKLPIKTFSSGPSNSMCGAAFLAATEGNAKAGESALVFDVGGTTTEVGVLLPSGFPRQAGSFYDFCGVRLNFQMPSVTSIGLGGGSKIRQHPNGQVTVGPDSVGYRLTTEAMCFGGKQMTASDIVSAAGLADDMGDSSKTQSIDQAIIKAAQAKIKTMLEVTLDSMKTSTADVPVYLVGGGSVLAPDNLVGVSRVVRFKNYGVANACGAAIAQISGIIDSVKDISATTVAAAQAEVEAAAIERAIEAGAHPDTVKLIESEAIPVAYTPGKCRFYVKAAGEWVGSQSNATNGLFLDEEDEEDDAPRLKMEDVEADYVPTVSELLDYKPTVRGKEWILSELDLKWIASGCYVLGCGGGGNPQSKYLELRELVRAGKEVRIIDLSSLKDDELIGWGGGLGSPEVSLERMDGDEYEEATLLLLEFMKIKKLGALVALEIGGGNGMINMVLGTRDSIQLPIIDGDYMGRAYPTGWQTTPNVYDVSGRGEMLLPTTLASGDGSVMYMTKSKNDRLVDSAFRSVCMEMGTHVASALRPQTVLDSKTSMIKNTVSLSWRIGRAINVAARQGNISNVARVIVDSLGGDKTAKVVFKGKITEVNRSTYKGHVVGYVTVSPLASEEESEANAEKFEGMVKVPFKNEFLYAEHITPDGKKTMVATVPDLISILDLATGENLGTPELRYGSRVAVLAITAAPQWTDTPRGLELGDLRAFGYDNIPYKATGEYVKPRSVIEEYGSQ